MSLMTVCDEPPPPAAVDVDADADADAAAAADSVSCRAAPAVTPADTTDNRGSEGGVRPAGD
jgi:hypothetical protein